MEKRTYPRTRETAWWSRLDNGLTVAVIPRKGFSKKMAYFVTGAGSMHREFTVDGKSYTAPMGVAHYLEHKLFDMPNRDVSAEFAALGASVNAFTSYDMTAYYFTCTEHFDECLRLLIEFVSTAYFTPESVEKEQGIIGQEIDMNVDSPENRVFESLMNAMYQNHPVREPILGTHQTIGEITAEVLHLCHRSYYCPENMILCVVGDVEPEAVSQIAVDATKDMACPSVELHPARQEPAACISGETRLSMEVARPMFQLGFKCDPLGTGDQGIYREFVGDLAAEVLFGESSELYLQLYNQGLIDQSFGGGLDTVPGMAMLTATGDSEDPAAVRDAILERGQQIVRDGIPKEDFMRIKRSTLGGRIRSLDSFDSVCFRICAYHFSDFDYFRFPEIYESVKIEDVQEFIRQVITPERCSLSVIEPKEEPIYE